MDEKAEKEAALRIIMRHCSKREYTFDSTRFDKVVIIKVEIGSITGKRSG